VDRLIAAHQLALLANILAVQNQILGVMLSEPGDAEDSMEAARRTMASAATTIENTIGFLQRLSDSEDDEPSP
jgi:hypothetical protein